MSLVFNVFFLLEIDESINGKERQSLFPFGEPLSFASPDFQFGRD